MPAGIGHGYFSDDPAVNADLVALIRYDLPRGVPGYRDAGMPTTHHRARADLGDSPHPCRPLTPLDTGQLTNAKTMVY